MNSFKPLGECLMHANNSIQTTWLLSHLKLTNSEDKRRTLSRAYLPAMRVSEGLPTCRINSPVE